jgi:hypothetical protein
MALWIGAASLGLAPAFGATDEDPPLQHILQFRGQVTVGNDGNGVLAATFATTADGPETRFVLYIDDALGTGVPSGVSIALNGDVVFQNDDTIQFPERVQVALNPVGGQRNDIVLTARGAPGTAARVAVLAVRPAPVSFGGRSILPLAVVDAHTRTALTVHNAGPARLALRILFFHPDGSLAGRTGPQVLPAQATGSLDLGQLAASSGIQWSGGAVHVQWASHGFTRVSTAATRHTQPADDGAGGISELALDDYGPFPLSSAGLRDIFGE